MQWRWKKMSTQTCINRLCNLHHRCCTVCCRYIFGLPLWQKNAVALSKEIIDIAEKTFSPGAVIGYELGNEVNEGAAKFGTVWDAE
jgi:hypothetical protein